MSASLTDIQQSLKAIASNYSWTWSPAARAAIDLIPTKNGDGALHPKARLGRLDADQWAELVANEELAGLVATAVDQIPVVSGADSPAPIAYFSPEFGVSQYLPQYSGGLGILAGDHLKSASDLQVPLVGVGLFYSDGYFHQGIAKDDQTESYETYNPVDLALADTGVVVTVPLGKESVRARVWQANIGSTRLFLLDTDLPENSPTTRKVSDRLYSGDQEHRVRQELVMGVGGARALDALGIAPSAFHLNEGHAGFLVLELIGEELEKGLSFEDAVAAARQRVVFTTHTPVPAGIDRFPTALIKQYLGPWAKEHGVKMSQVLALGEMDGDTDHLNMAGFCLRTSGWSNGVSALHSQVSREMFAKVGNASPIISITNGVHGRTWVGSEMQELLDSTIGTGWALGEPGAWDRAGEIPDTAISEIAVRGRTELAELAASRVSHKIDLDPNRLTVGFARRFATYKRADLLLRDRSRLIDLLANDDNPIQFVFAGKAHPKDEPGKAVLRRVVEFGQSPEARGRFVFIPDYDVEVARAMYAGTDVWLNTPIRLREACGTSGEKAVLNGGLNLSILDGWWAEGFNGSNGWAIMSSGLETAAERDLEEAAHLHELLKDEVVPLFYGFGTTGPTTEWFDKVRHAWQTMGSFVSSARMLREYDELLYKPAAR